MSKEPLISEEPSSMADAKPPNLPIFKFDTSENYFACRDCKTHLAGTDDFVHRYVENNKQYGLFNTLVNVVRDQDHAITNTKTTVISYYCINCKADLGFRFIKMAEETELIKPRRFLLYMNKLLLWRNKQMLDPEKEEELAEPNIQNAKTSD